MARGLMSHARKAVEARKVGASLVATFHRANPPLIWRFDLERNHSFTLTLQGEEGEWELGIASPKGEFHPIARFALREDAEESFNLVGDIMADEKKAWWHVFIKGIGIAFAALLVVALVFTIMVGRNVIANMRGAQPIAASGAESAPVVKNGVPISADDFLRLPSK